VLLCYEEDKAQKGRPNL